MSILTFRIILVCSLRFRGRAWRFYELHGAQVQPLSAIFLWLLLQLRWQLDRDTHTCAAVRAELTGKLLRGIGGDLAQSHATAQNWFGGSGAVLPHCTHVCADCLHQRTVCTIAIVSVPKFDHLGKAQWQRVNYAWIWVTSALTLTHLN